MKDKTFCPNCQNTMGFTFGTCIECGFNYINNKFEWVKVYVSELPVELRDYLIYRHQRFTYREPNDGKS